MLVSPSNAGRPTSVGLGFAPLTLRGAAVAALIRIAVATPGVF